MGAAGFGAAATGLLADEGAADADGTAEAAGEGTLGTGGAELTAPGGGGAAVGATDAEGADGAQPAIIPRATARAALQDVFDMDARIRRELFRLLVALLVSVFAHRLAAAVRVGWEILAGLPVNMADRDHVDCVFLRRNTEQCFGIRGSLFFQSRDD